MTQLDKLNDSLMPAHQRVIQLWVQSCCHLQDLSWGPGLHKEGAAIDITHLAQVALEAGRLVGVGHKAQSEIEPLVGVGDGTVHQIV